LKNDNIGKTIILVSWCRWSTYVILEPAFMH